MQSKRSGSSRAGGVGTTLPLILLATLLTVAAALFSFRQLQPDIEKDLTARVATALQGDAANNFSIDGQDVILTGSVSSEAISKQAEESARSVYGVSRVINQLVIGSVANGDNRTTESTTAIQKQTPALIADNDEAAATPATLTIASRDGTIVTQGIVPDTNTIDRINNALAGKFGRENVRDELSSFAGSESPQWLGSMISMIDQLDGIENPVIKITGRDVVLGGAVNAEQIRRVKIATAARLFGAELNVIDNLTIQPPEEEAATSATESESPQTTLQENSPPADDAETQEIAVVEPTALPVTTPPVVNTNPASIEIRSSNNQITLSGLVGSEADANGLRTGLDNLFGIDGYFDELEIADRTDDAPWVDDALIVTSEIRDVEDFAVSIRAGQMSLSGRVEDRETARDFSIAATEIAGGQLGVLNNFSVSSLSGVPDSEEDLLAASLLQELDALPTRNIVFNRGSTTLTDSASEVLDDVAAAILGYDDLVVEIAGHTDSSGDAVSNLRLSKERATAVRDYLVGRNVPDSRLSPIGYGETAPIADNTTEAGRAANRRIEFNL